VPANARATEVTAQQARNVAERAALVHVGATLTARDRALTFVGELRTATTREGAEQRIAGYEHRGTKARTDLDRDVRGLRTRFERGTTSRRLRAERFARRAERTAERRPNIVARRIARVETVLQAGVAAGERLAATAKERVGAVA
jgi:hypothetical protein